MYQTYFDIDTHEPVLIRGGGFKRFILKPFFVSEYINFKMLLSVFEATVESVEKGEKNTIRQAFMLNGVMVLYQRKIINFIWKKTKKNFFSFLTRQYLFSSLRDFDLFMSIVGKVLEYNNALKKKAMLLTKTY